MKMKSKQNLYMYIIMNILTAALLCLSACGAKSEQAADGGSRIDMDTRPGSHLVSRLEDFAGELELTFPIGRDSAV